MSKKPTNRQAVAADIELPSIEGDGSMNGHSVAVLDEPSVRQPAEETIISDGMQTIVVPLGRLFPGYMARRVDVQKMTAVQKENLKRVTVGLIAEDAHLENGKKVKNGQDAIKWILEQIAPVQNLP